MKKRELKHWINNARQMLVGAEELLAKADRECELPENDLDFLDKLVTDAEFWSYGSLFLLTITEHFSSDSCAARPVKPWLKSATFIRIMWLSVPPVRTLNPRSSRQRARVFAFSMILNCLALYSSVRASLKKTAFAAMLLR